MHFFLEWIERNDRRFLIASALLISLAILIKLPRILIGAPLLYLALAAVMDRRRFSSQGGALSKPPFENGESEDGGLESAAPWGERVARIRKSWELWLFALIALVPSAIWYWHAHRIAETFYPYHFFGAGGFRIMNAAWYWKIAKETVFSSLTPVLVILAVVGALVAPRGRYSRIFHWWLAAVVLFIFAAGWGNRHQWYQLPLVPISSVFAGCVCGWVASRLESHRVVRALVCLLIASAFAVSSSYCTRPFYWPAMASLRTLGLELSEATTANALIIAADDGDPTAFYYAHRKGWHFPGEGIYQGNPLDSAQLIANLEKLRNRGATHLVFYAGTNWWLKDYAEFAAHLANTATLVEQTREFTIYKLTPSAR
jgi:hypothetical protein